MPNTPLNAENMFDNSSAVKLGSAGSLEFQKLSSQNAGGFRPNELHAQSVSKISCALKPGSAISLDFQKLASQSSESVAPI